LTVNNVNDPPTSARVDLGGRELMEGEIQVLTIEIIDPDTDYGDTFNITWTIKDIGIVGYGRTLYLYLSKGIYSLSIKVVDGNGSTIYLNTSINVKGSGFNDNWLDDNVVLWALIVSIVVILTILIVIGLVVFRKRRSTELSDNEPTDIDTEDISIASSGKKPELTDRDNIIGGNVNFPVYGEDIESIYEDVEGQPVGLMSSMSLIEDLMEEMFSFNDSFEYSDDDILKGLEIKYSEGDISREELNLIMARISGEE
jgi:hypothetical protein